VHKVPAEGQELSIYSDLRFCPLDNPAKISIVVEGITEEGIPVTGKINYDVK